MLLSRNPLRDSPGSYACSSGSSAGIDGDVSLVNRCLYIVKVRLFTINEKQMNTPVREEK